MGGSKLRERAGAPDSVGTALEFCSVRVSRVGPCPRTVFKSRRDRKARTRSLSAAAMLFGRSVTILNRQRVLGTRFAEE